VNVLIVVPKDQREGGVASVVGNLARYLEEANHDILFLHHDLHASGVEEGRTTWGFSGVRMRLGVSPRIRWRLLRRVLLFFYFPVLVLRIAAFLHRHRIDVVNVHYPWDIFVLFAFSKLISPVRLVVSIHGAELFPDGLPRPRYSLAMRYLLARADVIVANSRAFRKDFVEAFPDHAGKTVVIHNGVDPGEWELARTEEPHAGPGGGVILCVAAHNEKKAIDVLIRAMADLRDGPSPPRLLLAGDGPLRDELESLARSVGVAERVEFLGHQPREAIHRLMAECDVFVLPSRSEPFGIVVTEALASGKPVVASAVGGITEIIEDGVSGILVPPDDAEALAQALGTVMSDGELRGRLGQAGPPRVEAHFTHDRTGSRYEDLFSSLLAGRSPSAPG
jgi:glycosyltransferase involved in cell wall biosynthesis